MDAGAGEHARIPQACECFKEMKKTSTDGLKPRASEAESRLRVQQYPLSV